MKKILLTCFLGGLCLLGRYYSSASGRVADSPGADFPHRSVPHRGGDARPDTFLTQFEDPYVVHSSSLSTLDGGPFLRSPILSTFPTRVGKYEVSGSRLPSSHGFSLVDDSNSQKQGSESDPAQGEDEVFVLKGLLKVDGSDLDELHFSLFTRELDPYYGKRNLLTERIKLMQGDFYSGTSGKKVFELKIPVEGEFGRLAIYSGDSPWLEDIWIQPGDSLVIHLEGSRLFFSGPSSEAVRIQIELQELYSSSLSRLNPVMILSNSESMLNTSAKQEAYQKALDNYKPGWSQHIQWLQNEKDRIVRAMELYSFASKKHPVLVALERNRDLLDSSLYDWLYAYWKGKLSKKALEFIAIANPSPSWSALLLEHAVRKDFQAFDHRTAPIELVEAHYLEYKLLSKLTPISFLDLTEELPNRLRDQVNAMYLIREYKNLGNADVLFGKVLSQTQSPEIYAALEVIYRTNLQGRDFLSIGFEDEYGNLVLPEAWKGKLVLLDFWLSGCGACLKFAQESFFPVLKEFAHHPEVLLVTVSGDLDREIWLHSLESGKYTSPLALNLFSGGSTHPTLQQYQIHSFPAQMLLDQQGRIVQTGNFPEDASGWIALIHSYLRTDPSVSFTSSNSQ